MKRFIVPAFAAVLFSGCLAFTAQTPDERRAWALEAISNWSEFTRVNAIKFMDEYGPPDRLTGYRMTWYGSGPWKRTEVWDETPYLDSNGGGVDLEQTIEHHVAADMRPKLAVFGGLIRIPKNDNEISARGGSEALDFLVINLAHQVIEGSMSPIDARRSYDRIALLTAEGKTSPYTQGILFEPEP